MDWKQITVNAITALFIAVLSGVLVWVFTRTPVSKEGLTYSVSQAGGFGLGDNRLTFYSVEVTNRGSIKAEDVSISINQRSSASLFQSQSQYARPIPRNVKSIKVGAGLTVNIPIFLPTDRARYSLTYKGQSVSPEVLIRSNSGVGVKANDEENIKSSFYSPLNLFLTFASFAISVIAARYASSKIVNSTSQFAKNDYNNSAFLLLHAGLFELANDVLRNAILNGQTGPIVLSNLAAVMSIRGDNEDAEKLISIAELWAKDKHSRSIVLFNKSIFQYDNYDKRGSVNTLRLAIETNKIVLSHCQKSLVLKKMMEDNVELNALVSSFSQAKGKAKTLTAS